MLHPSWPASDDEKDKKVAPCLLGCALLGLPPLQSDSLAERKQQLSEAIAINTSRISSSLRDQRAETLRTSLPGTLRVLLGAAIVGAFLFMITRRTGAGPR